jgi:hypothetical protein
LGVSAVAAYDLADVADALRRGLASSEPVLIGVALDPAI